MLQLLRLLRHPWQRLLVQVDLLLLVVHVLLRHCLLLHLLLQQALRLPAAVGSNPCSTCTHVCDYAYKSGRFNSY
jgi:hypothetical protein